MRLSILAMALAAASLGSVALAASDIVTPPDWLRRPSQDDVLAVWPSKDFGQRRGGTGVIACSVSAQGALFACRVISEKPEGSGFGNAAMALAPQFLMTPALRNGKPEPWNELRIPVNFKSSPNQSGELTPPNLIRPSLTNVVWTQAPTAAQVATAFPAKARAAKTGGNAVLDCNLDEAGRLTKCVTLGETPKRLDIARAAKTLTLFFVGPTLRSDGASTKGAGVQIPFTFPIEMTSATEPVVGKPRWTAAPTAEALAAAIPATAAASGIRTARVVLSCRIAQGGSLEACGIASEEATAQGFGAAALGLAKDIRVSIWTAEGLPTIGGAIQVPIRFDVPAAPAKP